MYHFAGKTERREKNTLLITPSRLSVFPVIFKLVHYQ